jgi:signal transduction histidine kinase
MTNSADFFMADQQSDYRQLLAQTQTALAETQALYQAVTAVASTLHLDEAIQRMLDQLASVIPHDSASIQLLRDGNLEIVAGHGWENPIAVVGIRFPIPGDNPNTIVIQKRQAFILNDAEQKYGVFRDDPLSNHIRSWLGVPMIVRDEIIGLLSLDSVQSNYFTEHHAELLSAFASPVAIAIENARLFEETKHQAEEMSALYETSLEISRVTELSKVLQMICERATKLIGVDKGGLYLYDTLHQELELVVSHNLNRDYTGTRLKRGEGISGRILQTGEPLIVDSYSEWVNRAHAYDTETFSTVIGVPMRWHDEIIGTITLAEEGKSRKFTQHDLRLLNLFANQAAIAIGNARLYEAERGQLRVSQAMQNVGKLLTTRMELGAVLERIFDLLAEVIDYDSVSIQLLDETGSAGIVASRGFEDIAYAQHISRTLTSLKVKERFQSRDVVVIPDTASDPSWIIIAGLERIQSWIGAILQVRGQLIGVLDVDCNRVNAFNESMSDMVVAFANQAAIAIENTRLYEAAQHEISRRVKAEQELRQLNDELEQHIEARTAELEAANERLQDLDEMKSRFVSNVSHELRTPIANLQFRMQLLLRDKEANRDEHLGILNRSLNHLETLIEDVLDLSRLDRDKSVINLEPVDLQSIIDQVADVLQPRAESQGIILSIERGQPVPPVMGSYAQLVRVVSNLIVNAINYTNNGSVSIQITNGDSGVWLTVADTGLGIALDDQPYIFDRFFRGADVTQSNIPGTGLGLSIVQEIINIHHGKITFESASGKGTTFRIWLPSA